MTRTAAPTTAVFTAGLVAVLAILTLARPARAQFSVRPVIVELTAGDSVEVAVLRVRNRGADTMQFTIYGADFKQLTAGGHRFLEAGTHPRSCAERMSVFPAAATLAPGQMQSVRVRMEPGPRTCWSLVFVESAAAGGGMIQIGQRIGVKVYGVPPGLAPTGRVTAVAVTRALERAGHSQSVPVVDGDTTSDAAERVPLRVTIRFRSTGQNPLRVGGRVEIRTLAGEVMGRVPVARFSVLPGHTREATLRLGVALPPGRYLAVPILNFGGRYLAGGQVAFTVPLRRPGPKRASHQ